MKAPVFFPLLLAAALAGCAPNQITGRNQLLIISEQQAIASSATAYTQMMGQLDKKKQIEPIDAARTRKVRDITNRLIAQAVRLRPDSKDWKWDVKVIDDPKTVNAFCMAGGKMAIYSGMWEQLKITDDELAQVMGHEISHALLDHTRERMSVARSTSLGVQALVIVTGVGGGLGGQAMDMAAQVAITLPNSREGESEADAVGTQLAARAGYDPKAAVTLWEKMAKLGKGPAEFLSTHPSSEHRAAKQNPPPEHRYVNVARN